ncbi:unnamed protein product [Orchesella dallaii]|uniref:CUB domain-containing protein n=1 Tax=Orchesella dallaii TaxID=48710 RepID=A0ABP1S0W8_9HEXA
MNFFACILAVAVASQFTAGSIIQGHSEKQPLQEILQFDSGLNPIAPTQSDSSLLTTCNGVLNSTSGGIAYKAFEPIAANERCVWTIRGGNAGEFSLNVLNIGSLGSQDTQVIVTCLRHRSTTTHINVNQTGSVNGVSSCNLLVITLASGSDVSDSTGFVLEYSVLRAGSLSSRSQDYIVNAGNAAIISYPDLPLSYTNSELSTFVILPAQGSTTNLIYVRDSLEGTTCYDLLAVYRFNASSTLQTKWEYEGRLCGNVLSDIVTNNDLLLITFESDHSVVGTGFQLALAASTSNQCTS